MVVRQALTGVAECLAVGAIETNDLNTAVSEACNNVVMHAYDGEEGPLEVDVFTLADGLEVVVRDRGRGIGTHGLDTGGVADGGADARGEHAGEPRAGIGIPVIEALARRAELSERAGGGTEVRMEFAAPDAKTLDPVERWDAAADAGDREPALLERDYPPDGVVLMLAPDVIARAVLRRVLSALAARAHFSTDRISDIRLIADALGANAADSIDASHLRIEARTAPRRLELRVGPLRTGRGESLMAAAADGLAPVVERLTDRTSVAPGAGGDAGETLELGLIDRG